MGRHRETRRSLRRSRDRLVGEHAKLQREHAQLQRDYQWAFGELLRRDEELGMLALQDSESAVTAEIILPSPRVSEEVAEEGLPAPSAPAGAPLPGGAATWAVPGPSVPSEGTEVMPSEWYVLTGKWGASRVQNAEALLERVRGQADGHPWR